MTTHVITKQQLKIYLFDDAVGTFHFASGDGRHWVDEVIGVIGLRLGIGRRVENLDSRALLVVLGHRLNGIANTVDGGCLLFLRPRAVIIIIHVRRLARTVHDLPRTAHHARQMPKRAKLPSAPSAQARQSALPCLEPKIATDPLMCPRIKMK